MCVRRCTRAACVAVLVSSAVVAASGSASAQSLTDALSRQASKVAAVGGWTTVTVAPVPPKSEKFDHWQAKIILSKPSFGHAKLATTPAAEPLAEHPYALHGPEPLDGPEPTGAGHALKGLASYYGKGERTATGEAFNPNDMTAAHRTLPFGTRVRVTRVDNGDSVVVRINDRGPFKPGRVIDLSQKAAENLRMTDTGLTAVKLEVLDSGASPQAENVAQRSLRR
jgi:rare lipoprotein A